MLFRGIGIESPRRLGFEVVLSCETYLSLINDTNSIVRAHLSSCVLLTRHQRPNALPGSFLATTKKEHDEYLYSDFLEHSDAQTDIGNQRSLDDPQQSDYIGETSGFLCSYRVCRAC
jgi:hypothetical protein